MSFFLYICFVTPQKQTIFNDFKKGKFGNCVQSCVASLFDLPLSQVPHFVTYGNEMMCVLRDFCDSHGYKFSGIKKNPNECDLKFEGVNGFYIIGGKSPRNKYGHAVIYKDGMPFFDVHPDNTFTRTIENLYLITRR